MNDILNVVNIDDCYFENIEKLIEKMESEFENKSEKIKKLKMNMKVIMIGKIKF